jgi:hypothetical protein
MQNKSMLKDLFLILDIPVGMMQNYILLISVIQSQPTHALVICNQATSFSSISHHQALTEKYEN